MKYNVFSILLGSKVFKMTVTSMLDKKVYTKEELLYFLDTIDKVLPKVIKRRFKQRMNKV